jgi:hypothetical protein
MTKKKKPSNFFDRTFTGVSIFFCWMAILFHVWIATEPSNPTMFRLLGGIFALFATLFVGAMTLEVLPFVLKNKEN